MKKVLSILLALCLLVGAVPMFASAADSDFVVDEYKTLVQYTGTQTNVVIPGNLGIRDIDGGAFAQATQVTSIVIPEGITSIGPSGFLCDNLVSITLPVSFTYIRGPFTACEKLTDIYYNGTEEQWKKINVEGKPLADALRDSITVHFNSSGTKPTTPTVGGFTDVKADAYYAKAVEWAVENGVTGGVSDSKFGPGQTCTRGQIVTFLWNAAGKPEPSSTSNKFTDVKAGQYYEKAVQWAVEKGITSGTSADKFSPNAPCTRAQAMTFIWVAAGESLVKDTQTQFTDLKAGSYYITAVVWAVRQGITSGTSATTFGPNQPCTRGQIVTFLYNWKN